MWLSKCRIVSAVNHAMKLSRFCSYMGNSAIPVVIWNNKKYLFCEEWLDYFDTACDWNVQMFRFIYTTANFSDVSTAFDFDH